VFELGSFIEKAFSHHSTIYFVLDDNASFVYVNKAIEERLGIKLDLSADKNIEFSSLMTRPKRWKLFRKEFNNSSEKGQAYTFQVELNTSENKSINFTCELKSVEFESKQYIFGELLEEQIKDENNTTQLQLSGLLTKNTNLLRERSFNQYIYNLIYTIQNLTNEAEIIETVCNRMVERENNEFSIERVVLKLKKSDEILTVFNNSNSATESDFELVKNADEFILNGENGSIENDGEGGFGIALQLYDVEKVDAVFYIKSHSEEQLNKEINELKIIINSMARQVSSVYLTNRLHRESIEDPLTGAFNRRYFDNEIKVEVNRAARYNRDLSMVFVDIDHFKIINDTYGHPQGDRCLVDIVKLCMETGRLSDHVYRYGGEEFVLLLPETNYEQSMVRAEKLRKSVEEASFLNINNPENPIKLTVSLGVSEYIDQQKFIEFINCADIAMYKAKDTGRNKVIGSR